MKKITIKGVDYQLDVEKAILAGTLKRVRKEIMDIAVGDVFKVPGETHCVLILSTYNGQYYMGGMNGLCSYSNFIEGASKDKIIAHLNRRGHDFITNINKEIREKLDDIREATNKIDSQGK